MSLAHRARGCQPGGSVCGRVWALVVLTTANLRALTHFLFQVDGLWRLADLCGARGLLMGRDGCDVRA
jgi:hypothetical protein